MLNIPSSVSLGSTPASQRWYGLTLMVWACLFFLNCLGGEVAAAGFQDRGGLGRIFKRTTQAGDEGNDRTPAGPAELKIIDRQTAARNAQSEPQSIGGRPQGGFSGAPTAGTREVVPVGYYPQTGRAISTPQVEFSPYDATTPPPQDKVFLGPAVLFPGVEPVPRLPLESTEGYYDPRFPNGNLQEGHFLPSVGLGGVAPYHTQPPHSGQAYHPPRSQFSDQTYQRSPQPPPYIPDHLPDQARTIPAAEHPALNPAYHPAHRDQQNYAWSGDGADLNPTFFDTFGQLGGGGTGGGYGQGYLHAGSSFQGSRLRAANKTATEIALELKVENERLRDTITRTQAELGMQKNDLEQTRMALQQKELELDKSNEQISLLNNRIQDLRRDLQLAIEEKIEIEKETAAQLKQIETMLDNVLMNQLSDRK